MPERFVSLSACTDLRGRGKARLRARRKARCRRGPETDPIFRRAWRVSIMTQTYGHEANVDVRLQDHEEDDASELQGQAVGERPRSGCDVESSGCDFEHNAHGLGISERRACVICDSRTVTGRVL